MSARHVQVDEGKGLSCQQARVQSLKKPWQGFAAACLQLSFIGDNLQNIQ